MKQFECTVYDQHGIRQQISLTGANIDEIKGKLLETGYSIVSVEEIDGESKSGLFASNKLGLNELEFFSSQLALLLKNGLKLDEALELVQKVATERNVKFVVGKILSAVREGQSLSQTLEPQWGFDQLYINLVEIGETSGRMDEVFRGIADDLKFRKQLTQKIKQALSYPALVLVFCISAILFVFNVVIPRMSVLFDNQENLPWYTTAMLGTADFVVTYQWLFLPVLGLVVYVAANLKRQPKLKRMIDISMVSLPLISTLAKTVDRIRYSSAMFLTLNSGISVERAMQYSAKVIDNTVVRSQLDSSEKKVRQGSTLASAFKQTLIFDDMHTGLIEVGERSGDLESIFKEIKEREQFEFDDLVTRFTSLLEPALILIMAGIVGSVVVIMLMSIIAIQDISF